VTLRTSIVAAGALVALLVPAAANAREVTKLYANAAALGAHGNHSVKSSTHRSSKKRSGSSSIVTPRYIYVPAPAAAPSSYADPNNCENSGNDCTDQQLCELWGESCDAQAPADAAAVDDSVPTSPN
jgi:hypothetical protein